MRDEFLQELIGMREYGEVPSALDRYKLLVRRLDGSKVVPGKRRGIREVLSPLEEKYWDGELQPELFRSARSRLRKKPFATQ